MYSPTTSSRRSRGRSRAAGAGAEPLGNGRVHHAAVTRHQRGAPRSRRRVEVTRPSTCQQSATKLATFLANIWLAWNGTADGRFVGPSTTAPPTATSVSGLVGSQFPPCGAARSTTTDPGPCASIALVETSTGAGAPGTIAVVTTTSAAGDDRRQQLALPRVERLVHRAGVAAARPRPPRRPGPSSTTRAPRLADLLGRRGPHVVALHHRSQAAGGGDGLQAGHAGPDDQDAGGSDRPRGGREEGEHLGEPVGRDQDGLVARPRSPATTARPSTARA